MHVNIHIFEDCKNCIRMGMTWESAILHALCEVLQLIYDYFDAPALMFICTNSNTFVWSGPVCCKLKVNNISLCWNITQWMRPVYVGDKLCVFCTTLLECCTWSVSHTHTGCFISGEMAVKTYYARTWLGQSSLPEVAAKTPRPHRKWNQSLADFPIPIN